MIALALLAVSPVGATIALIAAITIIGLPITLFIGLFPAITLIFVFLRLVLQSWRGFSAGQFAQGGMIGFFALVLAQTFVFDAWVDNAKQRHQAEALIAGDLDTPQKLEIPASLAVLRLDSERAKDVTATDCDDLCQRLLLNGSVKRLFVGTLPASAKVLIGESPGRLWSLEHRDTCPDLKIADQLRPVALPQKPEEGRSLRFDREPMPAEVLRLRIANGDCLIGINARLSDVDAVFLYGAATSGDGGRDDGSERHVDTVTAWRMAWYATTPRGFVERYRRTGVHWDALPYAYIPTLRSGYGLEMHGGYARIDQTINRGPHEGEPPVAAFLIERVGLDLRIDPDEGPRTAGTVVDRILASSASLSEIQRKILENYFDALSHRTLQPQAKLAQADAIRLVRIAGDQRMEPVWAYANLARPLARDEPDLATKFADAWFARLDSHVSDLAKDSWREPSTNRISLTAGILARLPDESLMPYRPQMERLMSGPKSIGATTALLKRLDVYGPDIVPPVLNMMDMARSAKGDQGRRSGRETAYDVGFEVLCKLGSRASDALPQLRDWLERADDIAPRTNRQMLINALSRMGASRDDVRSILRVNASDQKALSNFDESWQRSRGARTCE